MQITIWVIVWVIIPLILTITGNLLTPYIQKAVGNLSDSRKRKYEEDKRIFENSVQYLLDNPQERIYLRMQSMERSVTAWVAIVTGFVLVSLMNTFVVAIVGFVLTAYAYAMLIKDWRPSRIIRAAEKRQKAERQDINLG